MNKPITAKATNLRELFRSATAQAMSLALLYPHVNSADFNQLMTLLESLPLTSEEFGRAKCQLCNAARSLVAGEHQAGAFELKLLRKSLNTRSLQF